MRMNVQDGRLSMQVEEVFSGKSQVFLVQVENSSVQASHAGKKCTEAPSSAGVPG